MSDEDTSSEKIRILNLYAGIGGNRKLWDGNIEVMAVEIDPKITVIYQRFFPNDRMIVGDAHQFLLEHFREFDFIWSSPPCQSHNRINKFTRHDLARYPDMSLYSEVIFLQSFFTGKWTVENVVPYYEPLIPAQKCGRHLIWCNFSIGKFEMEEPENFMKLSTVKAKKAMMDWLGMHYEENVYYGKNHCPVQVLRNCVHPLVGYHIFRCAFREKQKTLSASVSLPSENADSNGIDIGRGI